MSSGKLAERLAFMKIEAAGRSAMQKSRAVVEHGVSEGLEDLYSRIRQTSEVSKLFSSDARINDAKAAQAKHWSRIATGEFSDAYFDDAQRIGRTHFRVGLTPQWYISGYGVILDRVIRAVVAEKTKQQGLFGKVDSQDLAETLATVVKSAMLDMDIAISTYIEGWQNRQREQERALEQAGDGQRKAVAAIAEGLNELAAGNLTIRITEPFAGEYEHLRSSFNTAIEQLQDAMRSVVTNAAGIRTGASEISQAADDLSRRTEQQAASLEQTAAALDEVTATVRKTAEGANHANSVVSTTRADAEASGEVVQRTVDAMSEIERSARQISQIIGVIDEIAFQTNLLALNAGVEAARAGEAGRGFAVVASEVRALAQRSSDAAKEIKGLISASSQHVEMGVELVGDAGKALQLIATRVTEMSSLISEIAASAQEQATALVQVNTAINHMDQVTQQNAAMVEQSTAASHSMSQDADKLLALVSRFDTGSAAPVAPARPAPRATQPAVKTSAPRPSPPVQKTQQPINVQRQRVAAFAASQSAAAAARNDDDWEEF